MENEEPSAEPKSAGPCSRFNRWLSNDCCHMRPIFSWLLLIGACVVCLWIPVFLVFGLIIFHRRRQDAGRKHPDDSVYPSDERNDRGYESDTFPSLHSEISGEPSSNPRFQPLRRETKSDAEKRRLHEEEQILQQQLQQAEERIAQVEAQQTRCEITPVRTHLLGHGAAAAADAASPSDQVIARATKQREMREVTSSLKSSQASASNLPAIHDLAASNPPKGRRAFFIQCLCEMNL